MFLKLGIRSLIDRKGAVALSLLAMAVSVLVLLGVEHTRYQIKENFSKTVSGVDLIIGARTSSLNLLLYSVFRIGTATNNISWESYEDISSDPRVRWVIPFSLGDSHEGYSVLGTTKAYFTHFSYGNKRHLEFYEGRSFESVFEVVLGSEVAKKLHYQIEDKLFLTHGMAGASFSTHRDHIFKVVGILAPTGTPVDQTVHVDLKGIEAIHSGRSRGSKKVEAPSIFEDGRTLDLQPEEITAFMVGLRSKITIFQFRKQINNYRSEPLTAILPGVALSELWQVIRVLENSLFLVSMFVFSAACLGMSAMLLSSIRERRREIQLLRVIGAPPHFLFFLIELEALLITLTGIILGSGGLIISIIISRDYLASSYGLFITTNIWSEGTIKMMIVLLFCSFSSALIPSAYIYKKGIDPLSN